MKRLFWQVEAGMETTPETGKFGEKLLKGIVASSGIPMGRVCVHTDVFAHIREKTTEAGEIVSEVRRLKQAASIGQEPLKSDRARLLQEANRKYGDIFLVHTSITEDSHPLNEIGYRGDEFDHKTVYQTEDKRPHELCSLP